MPFFGTIQATFNFGRLQVSSPTGPFSQIDLNTFSNWHRLNASNYTSNITNFYFYTFDGGANFISDGGLDMWDVGNYISLGGFRTAASNNYGTVSNTPQTNNGFFISQANVWPQIAFAYVQSGTIIWSNSGDVGSDGSGSFSNFSGSYTTSGSSGRYGQYWVNENYAAFDPTICYVWFTILNSNYGGAVTSCNDGRKQNVNNIYTQFFSVTGSNLCFSQMLLSRSSGAFIPTADISNYVTNYVANAQIIIS
jgi:hypothetical protein